MERVPEIRRPSAEWSAECLCSETDCSCRRIQVKLILCGNHAQFYDWCAENHVNPNHRDTRAKYVERYSQFVDLNEGTELILYGEYWDNPLHKNFEEWAFLLEYG